MTLFPARSTGFISGRLWPKAVLLGVVASLLVAAGVRMLPHAREALAWWEDDPPTLVALRLERSLTPSRVAAEIDDALAGKDPDLAASLLTLADQNGIVIAPSQRTRVTESNATSETPRQMATEFALGLATGEATSLSGHAGILAGDLTLYGDLRDLWHQGFKRWNGEPHDELVLGLAAVGIGLTGLTVATAGGALPARGSLTLIKTARKAGRLSPGLAASTTRVLRDVVDLGALRGAAKAASRFDVTAVRAAVQGAVRPGHLARLRDLADDGIALFRRTGGRATEDAFALARNAAELKKAARIGERYGSGTRAVLKILGRGAFVLTGALVTLAGWVLAASLWIWTALALGVALTRWLTQLFWPPRRTPRRERRADRAMAHLADPRPHRLARAAGAA